MGVLVVWALWRPGFGRRLKIKKLKDITCIEIISWSWSRFLLSLYPILVGGGIGWLMDKATMVRRRRSRFSPLGRRASLIGLVVGLVLGLRRGLSSSEIETRAVPNEGIRRSARNALVFGLVSGLIVGLVVGLVVGLMLWPVPGPPVPGPMVGLVVGLMAGLVVGLMVGLVFGLRAGGAACVKHVVLRLRLIRNGSTPWNYVRFLDYAAGRILLLQVGGGYAFLHRMLLEYFAARYVEPGIDATATAKSAGLEDAF